MVNKWLHLIKALQFHSEDMDREMGFKMLAYMRRRFHRKAKFIQYHARLKLCKDLYLRREKERALIREQMFKGTKMLSKEFMRLKMLCKMKQRHQFMLLKLIKIQSTFRMVLIRSKFKLQRQSSLKLQTWFRSSKCRRNYLNLLKSVCKLQK